MQQQDDVGLLSCWNTTEVLLLSLLRRLLAVDTAFCAHCWGDVIELGLHFCFFWSFFSPQKKHFSLGTFPCLPSLFFWTGLCFSKVFWLLLGIGFCSSHFDSSAVIHNALSVQTALAEGTFLKLFIMVWEPLSCFYFSQLYLAFMWCLSVLWNPALQINADGCSCRYLSDQYHDGQLTA